MVSATGYGPSVVFSDSNYLAVWVKDVAGGISGARISQEAVVLDPGGFAISDSGVWPSVAFDGESYFVTWAQGATVEDDIYGARVSQGGTVLDRIPICIAAGNQDYPSVAFDGSVYIVTWHDARAGDYDIYGCRVAPDGTVLDPDGFVVSTSWGSQIFSSVCTGSPSSGLVIYQGQTGSPYSCDRTYGVLITETGVEEQPEAPPHAPHARLMQNRPNPFGAGGTNISFTVDRVPCTVSLKVYDLRGRLVRTLVDEPSNHPTIQLSNQVVWDRMDSSGNEVASGVYFCRLTVYPDVPVLPALSSAEGNEVEGGRGAGEPALTGVEVFSATKKMVVLR